ncbi:MAG: HEAT repeat domain-containing protein [Verrucomicrobia bacterium]|nr:HEAT repeat domain-containing protein [Verrucomicrobiota bacterium]
MKYFAVAFASYLMASSYSMEAAEFKFPGHTLTVPDGFTVELVAGPPFIERPISMDFDERGRLYVTISSGSNDNVQKQLADKPHSVVRLEDTNGDGRYDKKTLFADKMMFPAGAMWFDGSLYVSAPPSIWKLTDTNDDGVADKREEWFDGKTLTNCANDLHGPHLGPDGWIYWCKGAFAEQTHEVNGKPFTSRAAHIFRARPDGSRIEPVMTGGMDNPSAIEFTPTGERLLVGTFFQKPEAGKRDGIIHAIYGGVHGKVNAVLDAHKKTGDLMPLMTHLGPSASCSIIQYRSLTWGHEFEENLFVANFNLHNVTRHVMKPHGATFRTQDETFLSSDNPDFHPTCLLEDADGTLLVIDTGGWYKLCCPTSQLWKPDVIGAIYRIRRTGASTIEDPRGLKLDWAKSTPAELTKMLDDERPRVVTRAIHQLAARKTESIPALYEVLVKSKSEDARRNAVWALTQIDDPKARRAVYAAFPPTDNTAQRPDETVVQAALYSIGLWRDRNALEAPEAFSATLAFSDALSGRNSATARVAAEALGRIGDKSFGARHLLRSYAWDNSDDRALEHSLIYALIELNDPESTAHGLTNAATQRGALIALDQMENGGLKPEQVTPFLTSTNAKLKETASWIASRHPEWGPALAGFFRDRLAARSFTTAEQEELPRSVADFTRDAAMQQVLADTLKEGSTEQAQLIALRAIAQSKLKEAPTSWTAEIIRILNAGDSALIPESVLAAGASPSAKVHAAQLASALSRVAANKTQSVEVRLNALATMPPGAVIEPQLFDFLRENMQPDKPVMTRSAAAGVLAKAKLNHEQLLKLADELKSIGPMEAAKILPAFGKTTNEGVGLKLIATLKEAKTLSSLRVEQLKPLFAKFPAPVQSQAESLLASLNMDAEKQVAHLDELLASLKDGDVRRGQAVFNSPQAACAACHAIGYAGGRLGPDLTKIGRIRNERDLLEAIVYPSASFVRSYESMVVVTHSGDDFSGVLKTDGTDEIVLATGPGSEVKIARKDLQEMRPGTLSVMPAGLDEQLSTQELADLIAFLKAAK